MAVASSSMSANSGVIRYNVLSKSQMIVLSARVTSSSPKFFFIKPNNFNISNPFVNTKNKAFDIVLSLLKLKLWN